MHQEDFSARNRTKMPLRLPSKLSLTADRGQYRMGASGSPGAVLYGIQSHPKNRTLILFRRESHAKTLRIMTRMAFCRVEDRFLNGCKIEAPLVLPLLDKMMTTQPVSSNPLEVDLVHLKHIAQDARNDSSTRANALKVAARIEEFMSSDVSYFSQAANKLGFTAWSQTLGDDELARLLADALNSDSPVLYKAATDFALAFFRPSDLSSESGVKGLAQWLFDVISVALADELDRRQRQNENTDGAMLREIVVGVDERDRGEQLLELSQRLTAGLWMPGDRPEGEKDAASEALTRIWDIVGTFTNLSPVAADSEALLAFMTAKLNRVLRSARDDVRTKIKTADRRAKKQFSSDDDANAGLVELAELRLAGSGRHQECEHRLLVEQILSQADLSEKEERVIKNHYLEDKTQKEIAQLVGISQGQVSKILEEATKKLFQASKNHLISQIPTRR